MSAVRVGVLGCALLALTGCAGEVLVGQEAVSRDGFGDAWPLTVDEGDLRCKGTVGTRSAVFVTGGRTYALTARAEGRRDGQDIEPIWAVDPGNPLLRKPLRPLIDRALDLCDPDLPRPAVTR